MTKKQRDRIVQLLGDGATLRESASIAQIPWRAFEREWSACRREHEAGKTSADSRWYAICQSNRSAYRATLRATAAQRAGTKASSDSLALLKHLEVEPEPGSERDEIRPAPRVFTEAKDEETKRLAREAMEASTALLEKLAANQAERA
jgi:hypothetical protein